MPIIRRAHRRTAVLAASVLVLGAAACTAQSGVPAVPFPPPTTIQPYSVPLNPPVATYTGYSPPFGVVTTAISGLSDNTTLSYSGSVTPVWTDFTVTLTNTSDFSFVDIEPLVVFGQCACNPQDYDIAPHTAVQFLDPKTQGWRAVKTADLNSHNTYSEEDQVAGIDLGPKATATFQYRMAMVSTAKEPGLTSGTSSLNIFVLQLPGRSRITVGQAPDATEPLAYHVG